MAMVPITNLARSGVPSRPQRQIACRQSGRSAARSLRSRSPPPPEFAGSGRNGAVRPKAWLGGDLAGFDRLIQQVAQPQCFLQRQSGQRMLAMQMANGVIVAALDVNEDMFVAGGD